MSVVTLLMVRSMSFMGTMTNGRTVLIEKTKGGLESLSPTLRTTHADPTVAAVGKIWCLVDLIHKSRDGGLVAICPECCSSEFTGPHRARNLRKHLERSCSATKQKPDYQRISCPQCGDLFTRQDNLHQHVKRKHSGSL